MPVDFEGFADHVVTTIKSALSPLLVRLAALEKREPLHGRDGLSGRDGKDADVTQVLEARADFAAMRQEWVAFKVWQEGRVVMLVSEAVSKMTPVTMELTAEPSTASDESAIVERVLAAVVKEFPLPKDGKDGTSVTLEDVQPLIDAEVEKAVSRIPVPKDGTDGKDGASDPAEVETLVVAQVTKVIAAIPTPQDGKDGTNGFSVTLEDVQPLIGAEVQKQFDALPKPKDGVGVLGLVIDRTGHLIATLSDGTAKDVGVVVGRDVDRADVERFLTDELAKWPRPKDGKDGLGFDDMEPVYDEFGRLSLRFIRGEQVKTARVPGQVDRGVYKAGTAYEAGDGVTWGGSFWIAQEPTQARPGDVSVESRAWRLAVKKGNDGKQGVPGEKGMDGKPGRDGVDRRYA